MTFLFHEKLGRSLWLARETRLPLGGTVRPNDLIWKCTTNLLDVVVGEGSAVLELFAGKNETLLIRGNSLLVLDLALYIVDGVGGLDLEGDGLAREGLDEDLHCRLRRGHGQRTFQRKGFLLLKRQCSLRLK